MRRFLILSVVAALAIGAALIGGRTAEGRSLSGCTLTAQTPYISGGWGHALAQLSGCSSPMPYTIRFADSNGNSLQQNSGTAAFGSFFTSPDAYCYGLSVHSFFTVNDGGTNKSSTSSSTNCF